MAYTKRYGAFGRTAKRVARTIAYGVGSRFVRRIGQKLTTRYRGRGGSTKTKTQQRRKKTSSSPTGAGRYSYFRYIHRSKPLGKMFMKNHARQIFCRNETQRISDGPGVQALANVASVADANQLIQMGLGLTNTQNTRMYLQSCERVQRFTNQAVSVTELIIYDCMKVRDNAEVGVEAATPLDSWRKGVDELVGVPTLTTPGMVGQVPFDSPYFTRQWKVMKTTKVILGPGDTHEHKSKFFFNRWINPAEMLPTDFAFSKLSFRQIAVVVGFPANDSTTLTQVSTAATAINVITSFRYVYYYDTTNPKSMTFQNNLPTAFTVGGQVMDEEAQVTSWTAA